MDAALPCSGLEHATAPTHPPTRCIQRGMGGSGVNGVSLAYLPPVPQAMPVAPLPTPLLSAVTSQITYIFHSQAGMYLHTRHEKRMLLEPWPVILATAKIERGKTCENKRTRARQQRFHLESKRICRQSTNRSRRATAPCHEIVGGRYDSF